MGEVPRSDEIIHWEEQGKTVIEGDPASQKSADVSLILPHCYGKKRKTHETGSIFLYGKRAG